VATYNPPKAKTPIRAIFRLLCRCKEWRTGIGKNKMMKSVIMCSATLEIRRAPVSRHTPGCDGFQNLDTGTQVNIELASVTTPQVPKNASMMVQAMRMD
jgi:hypothetical protein